MEFQERCDKLGDQLYEMYTHEETGKGCDGMGDLLLECAKSKFYGRLVQDHIPAFLELYQILEKGKHFSRKNSISVGDLDGDIWVEKIKGLKVIIATNHCVCRDDSTLIFIFEENSFRTKFLCRRVWARQKKKGSECHDHRDVDIPSIQTYRDFNFNFGYGDARDIGHCFSYSHYAYSQSNQRLDKPDWHEKEISIALRDIKYFLYSAKSGQ